MRVVVSGASGFIGTALCAALAADGHDVVRLVRRPAADPGERQWDPAAGELDSAALAGAGAVVALSGVGIGDRRWTTSRRAAVLSSRVESSRLIARTVASMAAPPPVFVQQSAVGYYGDRGDEVLSEHSGAGSHGFLPAVCRHWEDASAPVEAQGVRRVVLRTGLVLGPGGGVLRRLVPLFRLGLGGRLGRGRQWMSWISLHDYGRVVLEVIGRADAAGPVNAVSPTPVTNRDFTAALAQAVHRPAILAVPGAGLRVAVGRDLADELLLTSQRVAPAALADMDFTFADAELESALARALPAG